MINKKYILKPITISILLSTVLMSANIKSETSTSIPDFKETALTEKEKKSKESFKESLTVKKLSTYGIITPMKESLYIKDSVFYDIIRNGIEDDNLKESLYIYYNFSEKRKINKKIVIMPKYNKFFEEIKKSTDNDNLLASFIALNILEDQFLINSKNRLARKYLRDISRPLAKEGYPLGLFWYGKSHLKEWSYNGKSNYNKATKSYERAIENIDKKLSENTLNKKDKERLERFKQIVLLAKGKSSGLSYLDKKIENGERTKIKRKMDLSKYKKGSK